MNRPTEKQLDRELGQALGNNAAFRAWFLGKTKFADRPSSVVLVRDDYPWTTVTIQIRNPATGDVESIRRQGETDVLAVFEGDDGARFALHIENKLPGGSFTPYQPEGYAERGKKWVGSKKYGNYSDWVSVLVAPTEFKTRFEHQAAMFDVFISHEEVAEHIAAFGMTGS